MEIEIRKLDEQTELIKHYEKAFINNVFEIGKVLLYVRQTSLWKLKYETLKAYVEGNFSFSLRQAEKFMAVTTKFSDTPNLSSLGITKLYLLTSVPDEYIDEIIEKVEDKTIPKRDFMKIIGTMATQAGKPPVYTEDVNEIILSLKRQYEVIIEAGDNYKIALTNWIESAKNYQKDDEILKLVDEARKLIDL